MSFSVNQRREIWKAKQEIVINFEHDKVPRVIKYLEYSASGKEATHIRYLTTIS